MKGQSDLECDCASQITFCDTGKANGKLDETNEASSNLTELSINDSKNNYDSIDLIENRINDFLQEQGISYVGPKVAREERISKVLGKRRAPIKLVHLDL